MAELNKESLPPVSGARINLNSPKINPMREMGPTAKYLSSNRRTDTSIGEFDPENITFKQMYQMRRDPMIRLALHYVASPLVNAEWKIVSSDKQVAAFVQNALSTIYVPFVLSLLTSLDFGFSAQVKRFERIVPDWKYEDDNGNIVDVWPDKDIAAVVWNTFHSIPPENVAPVFDNKGQTFKGVVYSKTGDVKQIASQTYSEVRSQMAGSGPSGDQLGNGPDTQFIPAEYILWFTNEREQSFGNWYGYPRTGYAFRYWWSYWYRWLLGDRHFEQDADPPLLVSYPSGVTTDEESGEQVDNGDLALQLGGALRDGSTVGLPSDTYVDETTGKPTSVKMWDAKFLTGGENMKTFNDSFEYLDVMKLRSILVPEQALVEGKGGTSSRNVAATFGKIFAQSQAILMAEIDQVINDHLIPDLVRLNFVDAPSCKKVTTGFSEEDLTLAGEVVRLLANTSGVEGIGIDVKKLIEQVGLPSTNIPAGESTGAIPSATDSTIEE